MSYGKWAFTDDATGTYRDGDGSNATYNYSLKDLPTGDIQTSLNLGVTASPIEGSSVQLSYRFYDRFYSDWSANSREYSDGDTPDRIDP